MKSFKQIVSLDQIIDYWKEYVPKPPDLHAFAFFLYSDLSQKVAKYVNRYINILDEMIGPKFTVFVVDRFKEYVSKYSPSSKSKKWDEVTGAGPVVSGVISSLREGPFDIARHFEIDVEDVPCMIFFQHIEDTDVVVYPLDSKWGHSRLTKEFKGITSDVYDSISQFDDTIQNNMTQPEWITVMEAFWDKLCKRFTKRRRKVKFVKMVSSIGTLLTKIREVIS